MVRIGAVAILLGTMSGVSTAGPFTPKTMQDELAQSEVKRALVVPKGWVEFGVMVDTKRTVTYRGSDGTEREQPNGFQWNHSRLWLDVRQGFSPRVSLYAKLPIVRSSLQPVIGRATTTTAIGDAHTGLVVQPWLSSPHSIAFSLDLKSPSGVEWTSGTGAAGDTQSFLTGTGLTNLAARAHAKGLFGPGFSTTAVVGYVRKFPGVVGYVVEVGGFGNGVLNAGDEVNVSAQMTGQLGSLVWLRGKADYRYLAETWIGVNGAMGTRVMRPVRHSAGGWLVSEVAIGIDPTDRWTFEIRVNRDVLGGDSRPFAHLGLEELSPQPGMGLAIGAVSRW